MRRSYSPNFSAFGSALSVAALTAKFTEPVAAPPAPEPIDVRSLSTMQQAALMMMTESHVKRAIVAKLLVDSQDRPSLADYHALTELELCTRSEGKRYHDITTAGRFAALDLQHNLCIEFDIHLLAEGADHGWQQRYACPCGFATMVRRSRTAAGNARASHNSYIASRQGVSRLRLALAPGEAEG